MANPKQVTMDARTEFPESSPRSGAEVKVEVSASRPVDTNESHVNSPSDVNAKIRQEVANKIKSRFMNVDAVHGRAAMFDIATHAPGIDYTAGGLLSTRWVNNTDANINAKRMKGYRMPSEVSSQFKDIVMGNMALMVRTVDADADHKNEVERLNKSWEAKAKAKTSPKAGQGLGEFEVTPQNSVRG